MVRPRRTADPAIVLAAPAGRVDADLAVVRRDVLDGGAELSIQAARAGLPVDRAAAGRTGGWFGARDGHGAEARSPHAFRLAGAAAVRVRHVGAEPARLVEPDCGWRLGKRRLQPFVAAVCAAFRRSAHHGRRAEEKRWQDLVPGTRAHACTGLAREAAHQTHNTHCSDVPRTARPRLISRLPNTGPSSPHVINGKTIRGADVRRALAQSNSLGLQIAKIS